MVGDIHSYSKEMEGKKQMFWDRADSIWTFLDEEFRRKYPQFVHKFLWVPMYFASYDRYAKIPISERPKIKCLLSGCTHLPYYPIRDHIEKYGSPLLIDKPRLTRKKERKKFNPLGPWKYIGDDYARLLNSYFCCVTCSGIFHTLHGKYLEIMAAGSLLLADDCADVRKAGLVPGHHYVPITQKNSLPVIGEILKYPRQYKRIRKRGRRLALRKHSINNRFLQLTKVMEDLLNEREVEPIFG